MKIGEIDKQKCGDCPVIEYCGDPFDDLCLCTDGRLHDVKVEQYIQLAESSTVTYEYDKEEDEDYNYCRYKESICEDVIIRLNQ